MASFLASPLDLWVKALWIYSQIQVKQNQERAEGQCLALCGFCPLYPPQPGKRITLCLHAAFRKCQHFIKIGFKIRQQVTGRASIPCRSYSKTVFTLPKSHAVDMSSQKIQENQLEIYQSHKENSVINCFYNNFNHFRQCHEKSYNLRYLLKSA